jgi:hypothetical protein
MIIFKINIIKEWLFFVSNSGREHVLKYQDQKGMWSKTHGQQLMTRFRIKSSKRWLIWTPISGMNDDIQYQQNQWGFVLGSKDSTEWWIF